MSLPISTCTTPLGVIAYANQVRVYRQAESGNIHEIIADLSVITLMNGNEMDGPTAERLRGIAGFMSIEISYNLKDRDWSNSSSGVGHAHGAGMPGTAIAPVQANEGKNIRIYFQTPDLRLGELRNNDFSSHWSTGDYKTDPVMAGTSIAVLPDPGLGSFGYHLFFQGKDGGIWMSSQHDGWQAPRKILDNAMKLTCLAVINWNNGNDARLYYQDPSGAILELCRGSDRNGQWSANRHLVTLPSVARFCAICQRDGGVQISVFVLTPERDIIEFTGANHWDVTGFGCSALPGTDIRAVLYHAPNGQVFRLFYFTGPDKILYERHARPRPDQRDQPLGFQMSLPPRRYDDNQGRVHVKWEDVKRVATSAQSGDFAGNNAGTHFTDSDAGVGDKFIKTIRVNYGSSVNAITLEFSDDSSTGQRGGDGGRRGVFNLDEGEDIVQVLVRGDDSIGTLKFVTSNGRKSQQFGTTETGRLQLWAYQGQALAGFSGTSDQYLRSLTPLWAPRPARVGAQILEDLSKEAKQISRDHEAVSRRVQRFTTIIPELQSDLFSTIKDPCDAAINDVIKLGDVVKNLDAAAVSAKRTLIANSKALSIRITENFDNVHSIAQKNMNELDNQKTDVVYWQGQTESKLDRIEEMVKTADVTSEHANTVAEFKKNAVKVAERDISNAQAAKSSAQRDRKNKSDVRIVRDVFTVGLGELGDWGDLNSAIGSADGTIRAAEASERSANVGLIQAQATLASCNHDLQAFKDLRSKLNELTRHLQSLRSTLDGQRLKIRDIANLALDISKLTGSMSATSAPLGSIRTAADLAKSIQKLEDLIETNSKLSGLFISNPNLMDGGLEAIIAAADVPAADLI